MVAVGIERTDGGVGKLLPAMPLMACRLMRPHGEGGIEQQHTLLCPSGQVSAMGNGGAKVGVYLLKDVLQRGREHHAIIDREAQAMGLSRLMIGILPDDDHLHLVKGTEVEGVEYQMARWIACVVEIFLMHKVGEVDKVLFVKLPADMLFPGFFYLNVHKD